MSTVEDQCKVDTLHNETQALQNRVHLEISGSGIKRRLGFKKAGPWNCMYNFITLFYW